MKTPTNAELVQSVIDAVTEVQNAQGIVVQEAKKLAEHESNLNAHGLDNPNSDIVQNIIEKANNTLSASIPDIINSEIVDPNSALNEVLSKAKGPKGDKGEQGIQGLPGVQGDSITLSDSLVLNRSDIAASSKAITLVNTTIGTVQSAVDATIIKANTAQSTATAAQNSLIAHNVDAKAHANLGTFPAGTRLVFQQSAAPTGWVKETNAAYNNVALRFTTGNVTTGGSVTFTDAFKNHSSGVTISGDVGATTLATAQMPSHSHSSKLNLVLRPSGSSVVQFYSKGSGPLTVENTGGSQSHTHSLTGASGTAQINLAVKYADCIIATKS